ncbi:MAG: hypothetical protein IKI23_05110 [Lachnospiraceae bacterium]|jgi:hypothetical protein|nr:hypothetical protein [Lachnospiraceae bacterium]
MNVNFLFPALLLIAVILLIKVIDAMGKGEKEYDERQALVRGKAARYGYMTTLILLMPVIVLFYNGQREAGLFVSLAFFGGLGVYAVYNIWNGGFFRRNQNITHYMVLCFVVAGINLLTTFLRIREGQSLWEITTERGGSNFFLGILFAVIGVVIPLRISADRKEEE